MGYQRRVHGESLPDIRAGNMFRALLVVACVAYATAEAEAGADPYYGFGYSRLGYGGLGYSRLGSSGLGYAGLGYAGRGYYGLGSSRLGYYGKREAEAEPEAEADAEADPYYG